jgi:hypothetical protein
VVLAVLRGGGDSGAEGVLDRPLADVWCFSSEDHELMKSGEGGRVELATVVLLRVLGGTNAECEGGVLGK